MPHTRDKASIRTGWEALGLPSSVFRRMCHQGEIALDNSSPSQQRFQALLFDCLCSSGREHPWDRMTGRSFRDLLCYFSWVAPQPDRLLIRTNTADRIASYLLPYTRVFSDGSHEHSGIPGMRVENFSARTIHLRHLPTGGALDLQDRTRSRDSRDMREGLRWELHVRAKSESEDRRSPAHLQPEPSLAEAAARKHWSHETSTFLRSALMVRSNLWFREQGAFLGRPRRSNASHCLRWCHGPSCEEVGRLLTAGPLRIPGASFVPPTHDGDVGILFRESAALELYTPG